MDAIGSKFTHVKHVVIDPSALGLFGLAIITLDASTQKLGFTSGVSGVLPWAVFLGAFAQLIAAAYDAKHNNVFGATAFFAYGLFWLGIGFTWLISNGILGEKLAAMYDPRQLGIAYLGYLVFTIIMTIGALETNKVLFVIFCLIDLLFIGLAFSTLGILEHQMHLLAGIAEFGIAIVSFYGVAANLLNNHVGRTLVPVGKSFGILRSA
jgi:succinate-acetate transporter protein